MKNLTHILNTLCLLTIFFSTLSMQGMEYDAQLASHAEEYNSRNSVFLLPTDVLHCIVSHHFVQDDNQVIVLTNSIKIFMKLSTVCKKLNTSLTFETIGKSCQNYPQDEKNQTLNLISNYSLDQRRLPVLILVCAGADTKEQDYAKFLLEGAVHTNDLKMVEILFKHHANPNEIVYGTPVLMRVKTRAIAQEFIDNDVDLQLSIEGKNILWYTTKNEYTSDLMAFYIKHQVDAEKLSKDKSCLLHELAGSKNTPYHDYQKIDNYKIDDVDDFLKKAQLLLSAIPTMINQVNERNETPLQVAYHSWFDAHKDGTPEAFEKLMKLFARYGGVRQIR